MIYKLIRTCAQEAGSVGKAFTTEAEDLWGPPEPASKPEHSSTDAAEAGTGGGWWWCPGALCSACLVKFVSSRFSVQLCHKSKVGKTQPTNQINRNSLGMMVHAFSPSI